MAAAIVRVIGHMFTFEYVKHLIYLQQLECTASTPSLLFGFSVVYIPLVFADLRQDWLFSWYKLLLLVHAAYGDTNLAHGVTTATVTMFQGDPASTIDQVRMVRDGCPCYTSRPATSSKAACTS